MCQLIDACSEQVLEYTCSLIATTVLHDAGSNDWDNDRPFYEGEKVSHSIQVDALSGAKRVIFSKFKFGKIDLEKLTKFLVFLSTF